MVVNLDSVELLVVDDDPKMVKGLEEILEGVGYIVTTFDNPLTALESIKKRQYVIALIDLIMPGKNGIELLKEIKENKPNLKVIIITGFATIESAVEAMREGAIDYISKPFKINEVQNAIKKTLEEIKFEKKFIQTLKEPSRTDKKIKSLANPIRRSTIALLGSKGKLRFTDILNTLGVNDPTKLSFHLRELKETGLITQDQGKSYSLTKSGLKTARLLKEFEKEPY
jgi:FixJ family two-component response regulator